MLYIWCIHWMFVVERVILCGHIELRATMSDHDYSNIFESKKWSMKCYEAALSEEIKEFGFAGESSVEESSLSLIRWGKKQFIEDTKEELLGVYLVGVNLLSQFQSQNFLLHQIKISLEKMTKQYRCFIYFTFVIAFHRSYFISSLTFSLI